MDERALQDSVRYRLAWHFLAEHDSLEARLRAIAEDSVHRTISRGELVAQLNDFGFPLRNLPHSRDAVDAVRAATDPFLTIARNRLIQRGLVPNSAAATLLSRLEGPATDTVLTGRAGSGKTTCTLECVEALREQGPSCLLSSG